MYGRLSSLLLGLWLAQAFMSGQAIADHRPGNIAVMAGTWALTGQYVKAGRGYNEARNLYLEQLNARGGLLGHKVEIKIFDDKSNRRTSIELYEKIITEDTADIILGPLASHIADAVANVMERYKRPFIALGAVSPTIFQRGRKYVFRPISVVSHDYQKGALLLAKQAGVSRIAVIGAENQFSRQVSMGAVGWAKKLGLEVVLLENFRAANTDFTDLIKRIGASGAEAVFMNGLYSDSIQQIRHLQEQNIDLTVLSSAMGATTPEFTTDLGSLAEFVLGFSQWLPNPEQKFQGVRDFIESYQKKYGGLPTYRAARAYAAMQVLEAATKRAGSFDPKKLRDALSSIKVETVMGPWEVDDTGFMSTEPTIIQIQGGRRVIVWPPNLAEAKFLPMPKWKDRIRK